MTMNKVFVTIYILLSGLFAFPSGLAAQTDLPDSLIIRGDAFHSQCDFDNALDAYEQALEILEQEEDSVRILSLRDKMLLSENGRNMSGFAYSPYVVAKHKFSLDEFFLYYPLQDRSWRMAPNQLDSTAYGLSKATFVPEYATRIFFSSEDEDGIRNIYVTEYQDTVWTIPSLLNEHLVSPADEIYPMLSSDGRTMYFASEGLYGVGGYDIYMSEWSDEENDWSVPVNMGFPYSSPADDFLLVNTDDNGYSFFASNRDCSADSVWVYVLEFDNMPVRKAIEDPHQLRELLSLEPSSDSSMPEKEVSADIPESVDTRRYMEKMVEVRALRDSLSSYSTLLENERNLFALSNDYAERTRLTDIILRREARIPQLQDSLDRATSQLQKIEMEFLFSGVVIDLDKMMAEADREVVGDATSYTFTKMNIGDPLHLKMMEPEEKFDYSFKVLDEGQFAEDNTIPEGIVYQIQIFSSINKASVKNLKGLSPVFEHRNAGGRYLYRVGLFNTYNDVLSKLNTVKKVGFRSAFIVAYIDGKEVLVSKARTMESKAKEVQKFYQVTVIPSGDFDPVISDAIRQQAEGKDIARSETEDGRAAYIVGPFSSREKADSLASMIRALGTDDVRVSDIENK